jgi:hypothetical protein
VSLFTQEEKEGIEKEFTRSSRANRNQLAKEGTVGTIESDWFTERNIDCTQNELTRNISSKSIILAPFNSTISLQSGIHPSVQALAIDKAAVQLSRKIRDIDRQYEKNNNGDVDNGVYNHVDNGTKGHNPALNPLASNECDDKDIIQTPAQANELAPPSRSESLPPVCANATVQAYLLKSLMPAPLVVGMIERTSL